MRVLKNTLHKLLEHLVVARHDRVISLVAEAAQQSALFGNRQQFLVAHPMLHAAGTSPLMSGVCAITSPEIEQS